MKVRIAFTVDIDPQAWADTYGVDVSEVRQDVNSWARGGIVSQIMDAGVGGE